MIAVKAYYDGKAFVPISPVKAAQNQAAIVTVLDNTISDTVPNEYLRFAGSLSDEDYREISEILKSTEQVNGHEW
jgi:hypothetical protein